LNFVRFCEVSNLCVSSANLRTNSFCAKKRESSIGVEPIGGHRPHPSVCSPDNSCSKLIVFAVWGVAPSCSNKHPLSFSSKREGKHLTCQHCPTPDMSPIANTSSIPTFCYHLLLSNSVLSWQSTYCYMFCEQQQINLMRSSVKE
jgi:hypothetical protein